MTSRPFCVGLTGGIGCGKSTIAERFSQLGAVVIDTDVIAHELTAPTGAGMPAIINAFGLGFVTQAGALDRAVMRAHVFADPEARNKLQSLLHPLIQAEVIRRIESPETLPTGPYFLLVVPLLVENLTRYRPLLDRIAVVDCDESQQLARTAARPGLNDELVKAILAAQVSRQSRREIADDLIDNQGELGGLDPQIQRLHALYLTLANHSRSQT